MGCHQPPSPRPAFSGACHRRRGFIGQTCRQAPHPPRVPRPSSVGRSCLQQPQPPHPGLGDRDLQHREAGAAPLPGLATGSLPAAPQPLLAAGSAVAWGWGGLQKQAGGTLLSAGASPTESHPQMFASAADGQVGRRNSCLQKALTTPAGLTGISFLNKAPVSLF